MKPNCLPVALATWLLGRLTPQSYREVLAGDLLEELSRGRSALWFWRQVTSTIALHLFHRSRSIVVPLAFSVAWSLLYPAWQLSLWSRSSLHALVDRWSAFDWPLSAVLELGTGIVPATTFVCLGLLLFFLLPIPSRPTPSTLRLFGSLSLSLNVLLVSTMALLSLSGRGPHNNPIGHELFYVSSPHPTLSIPITLALLSALLAAFPPLQGPRPASPLAP